jgi:four helix bundle protein
MDHKSLDVWNAGMELVTRLYEATRSFPAEEIYGLTSQLRRSAVSIPSNIAEGAARNGDKEFVQFLYVALGSLAELETQIILSERLGYLSDPLVIHERILSIKRMLLGLIKHLKQKKIGGGAS